MTYTANVSAETIDTLKNAKQAYTTRCETSRKTEEEAKLKMVDTILRNASKKLARTGRATVSLRTLKKLDKLICYHLPKVHGEDYTLRENEDKALASTHYLGDARYLVDAANKADIKVSYVWKHNRKKKTYRAIGFRLTFKD